jgi:hypothetical protein
MLPPRGQTTFMVVEARSIGFHGSNISRELLILGQFFGFGWLYESR